jgi:ATP citrate (pro-S)-lyase
VVTEGGRVVPLDLAAKVDETASFLCGPQWGHIDFPAPFGRREFPEEAYIRELDSKTGSSLKLTILNPSGRVWTMVAGGGASVVYADSIADLGQGHELANYGEYSGAPNEQQTFDYARTILGLMTRVKDPRGKVLIIGGGIANFTDVAATFKGIITALRAFQEELRDHDISIWVRRAGPNYQEGLRIMRDLGAEIRVPIKVYGPETHVTAIVPLALGLADIKDHPEWDESQSIDTVAKPAQSVPNEPGDLAPPDAHPHPESTPQSSQHRIVNFTEETRCIVYGLQQRAVQGMLDFDFMCKRKQPSVAAMIFPFSGNHYIKFYWGTEETLIPVYQTIEEAIRRNKDANVVVNFASFRSVHETMMEILRYSDQIKTVAIIAEGVPESQTRDINLKAKAKGVGIIGPATVGGIKPGCFRIGNTGGMLDNIVSSKLYRPGSVAYVSKSGGMSNELNNIISRNSDGVYEGVAIGGDRYPGTGFIEMLLRYNDDPQVKMMVLLGEVGGTDEYAVCEALKSGRISKPLIAWCIGTCASLFPYEVQFGHAGACARGMGETAAEKNTALKEAGALVPATFDKFGVIIRETYSKLVASRVIVPRPEPEVPKVPLDYTWAKKLGLVRKPANFISSISDDRGDELRYAGMKISEIFEEDLGLGGVVGLLWFRRRLPAYATKFIEMVLMVTADHGPAVSGAHNTIVTARAGKDLVSSLTSGLLTIGPRFGGALDDAAEMFTSAHDKGMTPAEFVKMCKNENRLIMGIGHRIKSLTNPDARVVLVKEYAKKHFKNTEVLDFALGVEQITTKKRDTLILNVDGACQRVGGHGWGGFDWAGRGGVGFGSGATDHASCTKD